MRDSTHSNFGCDKKLTIRNSSARVFFFIVFWHQYLDTICAGHLRDGTWQFLRPRLTSLLTMMNIYLLRQLELPTESTMALKIKMAVSDHIPQLLATFYFLHANT